MIVHAAPQYRIYFGDANDAMYPSEYLQWRDSDILSKKPLQQLQQNLKLDNLMFLHQRHGCNGLEVTKKSLATIQPFGKDGDFLVTQFPSIGIGVLTADCLPVVFYDRRFHVAAVAHAGWRGAVLGIIPTVLRYLQQRFGSNPRDITTFFGPSAKRCCYEVTPDFIDHLDHYPYTEKLFQRNASRLFFDLPMLVELQLLQEGILAQSLHRDYNDCTICDTRFHSHRRGTLEGKADTMGRQMTIIMLK